MGSFMNDKYARELSHEITNDEIYTMLEKAKVLIKDWRKASKANKGLSRGVHWNMFAKEFDVKNECSHIFKYRLIQEYGEFLPDRLQPQKKERHQKPPSHQDPIFD